MFRAHKKWWKCAIPGTWSKYYDERLKIEAMVKGVLDWRHDPFSNQKKEFNLEWLSKDWRLPYEYCISKMKSQQFYPTLSNIVINQLPRRIAMILSLTKIQTNPGNPELSNFQAVNAGKSISGDLVLEKKNWFTDMGKLW